MRFVILLLLSVLAAKADWRINSYGHPWYVAFIGDSITRGYTNWATALDGGPSGDTNSDVSSVLWRQSGGKLTGTNFAKSGRTWLTMRTEEFPSVLALNPLPSNVVCMVGVNNLSASDGQEQWTNAVTNLNIIANALFTNRIQLYLLEILPSGSANAVKQTWNGYYLEWTQTNTTGVNVHFVYTYTNFANMVVDAQDPTFTWDSVHLTPAGTSNYARVVLNAFQTLDPSFVVTAPTCPVITDAQTNSGAGSGGYKVVGDALGHTYISASFRCSNSATMTGVELVLSKQSNAVGTTTVYLYSDSSSKPGTLLATGSAVNAASGINQFASWTDFSITNALTSNTVYHLVLGRDTIDANNNVRWWNSTDTSKNMSYSTNSIDWTITYSANVMFRVLTQPCQTPGSTNVSSRWSGNIQISGGVILQ